MPVTRRIVVGLVMAALVIAVAAFRLASANQTPSGSSSQALSPVFGTPALQQPGNTVWGRVPYCSCNVGSATASVAGALEDANLVVALEELSPKDGWLYFAATFDPHTTTRDQVGAVLRTSGAQVVVGPP